MVWKPFESKSVLDIRKSTKISYPPKRALPSNNGSFTEMEHYHYDNYDPFGEHPIAKDVEDNCEGRVLRPVTQETWPCGGEKPQQFQVGATGGIGTLTYSLDPRWREVNEEGDQATISESGVIQIGDEDTEICSGAWPPWIIYRVCDDCGCSFGTILLEDCSGDCCTTPCDPLPTVSGADTIGPDTTGQYSLDDAQGTVSWAISGSGFSIDQNGLVTTSSACGTATITATDSCCGDFTKDIRSTDGQWSLISSESGGISGTICTHIPDFCSNAHGASSSLQSCIIDGLKYEGRYRCMFAECDVDCDTYGPSIPGCWSNTCGSQIQYVHNLSIYEWICP